MSRIHWMKVGATVGLLIAVLDLTGWRGQVYWSWDSPSGLGHNVGYFAGVALVAGFIGFILGAIRDGFRPDEVRVTPDPTGPEPYYQAEEIRRQPMSPEAARLRRKAHRLGIFITLVSLPLMAVAALSDSHSTSWAAPLFFLSGGGVLFGYVFSRLWYWFRAA